MRIRKRPVLSSFSPLHLSDPHLINRSPVVVQLGLGDAAATSTSILPQQHGAAAPASSSDRHPPSDQPLQLIGKRSNGCDDPSGIGESGAHKQHNKQDPLDGEVRGQESGDSGEKGNHTRKGDIFSEVLPPSTDPFPQDGRWCEGEKAIPLKKRRGNFENGILILENNNNATHDHSGNSNNGKKITKPRMKTKMNKKCSSVLQNGNNSMELREDGLEEEAEEAKPEVVNIGSSNKKRTKGSAVMEGSRCSRVNGRGWRCCQQTLVGYSLCEHHLGKGRLRSMTSVRNRSIGATTSTTTTAPAPPKKKVHNNLDLSISVSGAASSSSSSSSSSLEKQMIKESGGVDDDPCLENNETKKAVVITTKKRMKLGMVKARSISSLLGQTNTTTQPQLAVVAAADENNK